MVRIVRRQFNKQLQFGLGALQRSRVGRREGEVSDPDRPDVRPEPESADLSAESKRAGTGAGGVESALLSPHPTTHATRGYPAGKGSQSQKERFALPLHPQVGTRPLSEAERGKQRKFGDERVSGLHSPMCRRHPTRIPHIRACSGTRRRERRASRTPPLRSHAGKARRPPGLPPATGTSGA